MTGRLIVVTPHIGDAVQSCGELLASNPGALVVTIFAAIPANAFVVTEWDAACGFASPQQAMVVRRREDRQALDALDAEPCWLACRDSQYRRPPDKSGEEASVALSLGRALRRHGTDRIAIPLGLLAGDHALAHRAALRLLRRYDVEWLAYEDSAAAPEQVASRIASLEKSGIGASPIDLEAGDYAAYRRRRAAECYESLLRGYAAAGRAAPAGADRYWSLSK
jgi:LmbE family N-acetylglucosaminyl deacetylase